MGRLLPKMGLVVFIIPTTGLMTIQKQHGIIISVTLWAKIIGNKLIGPGEIPNRLNDESCLNFF